MRKQLCPVCGQHEFEEYDEFCPVCGWWHDKFQEMIPDEWGGPNYLSLNQSRDLYKKGRVDLLRHPHAYDENAERLDGIDGIIAGLTPGEMLLMGKILGDRVFFAKNPSVDELRTVYPLLQNTRMDSIEDDRLRLGLIDKLKEIM